MAQLPVQCVIHRPQPGVRGLQDPVGHGLPGQLQALPLKLLLQTVQRRVHDKFLGHNVGHCLRRGKTARAECGLFGCFPQISFPCLRLALLTGVGVVHIFLNPEPGRFHLQVPADFFPNLLHHRAADIADAFLFGKPVLHHFRGGSFRHDVQHVAALPFAGVGFHLHLLLCGILGPIGISFRLIGHERQLVHEALLEPLGRLAKLTLLGKAKLLQKPLVLEL